MRTALTMAEEFNLIRRGNALIPADEYTEALLMGLPPDGPVRCTVKIERRPNKHRLFWRLNGHIALGVNEIRDRGWSADTAAAWLKIAAGYFDQVPLHHVVQEIVGQKFGYMPRSLAFSKMSDQQMSQFINAVLQVIHEHFYPHFSRERQAEIDFTIQKASEFER